MSEPGVGDEAAADEREAVHGWREWGTHGELETFDGMKHWDEWYFHFENVVTVGMTTRSLGVRITGRACRHRRRYAVFLKPREKPTRRRG